MSNKICIFIIAVAIIIFASAQCIWADTGFWSAGAANPGDWSVANNWDGGTVADGDGNDAWFNVDVPTGGIATINVDAGRAGQVIGNLNFLDSDVSTPGSYLVQGTTTLNLQNSGVGTSQIYVYPLFDPLGAELLAAEISAPMSVADGTSLTIVGNSGTGTLKLSGNTTVINGSASITNIGNVILTGNLTLNNGSASIAGGSTVNLSGGMSVSGGNTTVTGTSNLNVTGNLSTTSTGTADGKLTINGSNAINLSGTGGLTIGGLSYVGGTLNVGLSSGDAATATFKGGDTSGNTDAALDAGGGSDISTINVRGTSTISTTGAVEDEVRLGTWGGTDKATLNMYDSSVLNTALLCVVKWGNAADVNLYDKSKVNATNVDMNSYASGATGNINMHNNSTLTVTGTCWVAENQGTGASSTSNFNMYENSVANVGTLSVIRYGTGCIGNVNLYDSAQLNATGVIMSEYAVGGTGTINLHNTGTLTVTGTFIMGGAQPSGTPCTATLNMDGSSVLNAAQLTVVRYDGSVATVNLHGSAQENATNVVMNDYSSGGTGIFNMYDTSTVTATNLYVNTNQGSGTGSTSTLNMYNNSVLNVSGTMTVVRWGFAYAGNVNLNDSARVNAGTLLMCDYMDPTWTGCVSKFTLNNSSKLYVTTDATVGANQGSSIMTVNDTAEVHVTGTLYSARSNRATGIPNYGEVDVNGSGKIFATNITMGGGGNAAPNNATSLWNITDNGAVSASGNLSIAGGTSSATVNMKKNAQLSVTGNVTIGNTTGVGNSGYVDVTGSGASIGTSLNVGGNVSLVSTNSTLIVNSVGSGPAPNGGLQLTGAGSTLYFNGGQIKSGVNTTTFLQGIPHAIIQAGGAVFNLFDNNASVTRSVTVAQNLEHDSVLGSTADGGLSIMGGGTLTLTGALTYTGPTKIQGTSTLKIYTPGSTALADISTITGTPTNSTLVIGDGSVANTVSANSVSVSTLTIGAGSTLTINAIPGGPLAGGGLTPVPEPSVFVLLTIATLGLIGAAWRKRK